MALLCSAVTVEPLPVENRGVDAVVARLILENLNRLGRGEMERNNNNNNTDWKGVWRSIAASPDSEWGMIKRAVSLAVLAAQGTRRSDPVLKSPPVEADLPLVQRAAKSIFFIFFK